MGWIGRFVGGFACFFWRGSDGVDWGGLLVDLLVYLEGL